MFENSIEFARGLDERDVLKDFRSQFCIPVLNGKEQIYFLGNSLGLQPKNAKTEIDKVLNDWATFGVEAFSLGDVPWMDYHDLLIRPLSRIVGALPHEITVMNQLTVNLHLMLASFYRPEQKRNKIICEAKAFPSDQYMFETQIRHHGLDPASVLIEVGPRPAKHCIQTEDILHAIDQHNGEVSVVLFSGVNYYTGQLFDIPAITDAAHRHGARVGFDLAHAAGNVPLQLHAWNVDFACWCSYKYLNSGPGAVGAAYIHEKFHRDESISRLAGWWGYEKSTRFKMEKGFKPVATAEGWQLSTPSILLYAAHKASLDIFEQAGWERLRAKQDLLTAYLWFVLDEVKRCAPAGAIEFITPRDPGKRGCQVSILTSQNGKKIFDRLTSAGIVVDWREPNVIRIAPVPLYNTFEEVCTFGNILLRILTSFE